MKRELLQHIISDIPVENLPPFWVAIDHLSFSDKKKLFDYQQQAILNALKVLKKYYKDFVPYSKNELLYANEKRKISFYNWYVENNLLKEKFHLELKKLKSEIGSLLSEYYASNNGSIPFHNFVNRMNFWMATASGKSVVLIKLVYILRELISHNEIPSNDILILTYRDDLIEQIKSHIREFNSFQSDIYIKLHELRSYEQVKRENSSLFRNKEINVFIYRSDNLSDDHKEKIVDFRNYDNDGKWYIFLDEAHKGDKEDSKRQHIYSILSRNGFLFNFSATFTDERDYVTTAFNFNLAEYIRSGYGKHITILEQEIRQFRSDEDYTEVEKQKIVLKTLIMLAYIKKNWEKLGKKKSEMYHNPMMVTLVNSVNTENADLKLFFRELEKIGNARVKETTFESALRELLDEFSKVTEYLYESDEPVIIDKDILRKIKQSDILQLVFNTSKPGNIEAIVRPSNKQELVFRLKSATKPFALIKIGDISSWIKEELSNYDVEERFEDETYFENLNKDDSDINILMGSRSFYEGWDSNRPNVLNYINIGTGDDAYKFILQSVGRGVRVEPIKNKRKRLKQLFLGEEIDNEIYQAGKEISPATETLFIFGTNRITLTSVIERMKEEGGAKEEKQLELFLNPEVKDRTLLVPTYKISDTLKFENTKKFEVSDSDLHLIDEYISDLDDRILLMHHVTYPKILEVLRNGLKEKRKHFVPIDRSFDDPDFLLSRIFEFYRISPREFSLFKPIENEIQHYKKIQVALSIYENLLTAAKSVLKSEELEKIQNEAEHLLKQKKISLKEYTKRITESAKGVKDSDTVYYQSSVLHIKQLPHHYYLPVIYSDDEKIAIINHIIRHKSEVKFVNELEKAINEGNNPFKEYDWWMFSKLDEHIDQIYIPYFNPQINDYSRFCPDFVFWLQKGNRYSIIFVDPKGTEYASGYRKIDGYKEVFEENEKRKVFQFNGFEVDVKVKLFTIQKSVVPQEYRQYWFDDVTEITM